MKGRYSLIGRALGCGPRGWRFESFYLPNMNCIHTNINFSINHYNKNFYILVWIETIYKILGSLRIRIFWYCNQYYTYNLYFNKRYTPNKLFDINPIGTKILRTNARLVHVYKAFLNTNSFYFNQNLTVNYNWVLFSIYNSTSNAGFINIRGLFIIFKNFYYLMYNLSFFNIKILYFGNNFFKTELISLNHAVSTSFSKHWRYSYNFFTIRSTKIFNNGWLIFDKLKSRKFNVVLVIDIFYHRKTFYYLNRSGFFTLAPVPINYNPLVVNLPLPTSSDNFVTQLFFINLVLIIYKNTRYEKFLSKKDYLRNFYQSLFL